MAVVCDFKVIQDGYSGIGDNWPDDIPWEKNFNISGLYGESKGILMFMVAGLTATTQVVRLEVNGHDVGWIGPYTGGNQNYWYAQVEVIQNGVLHNGENTLRIMPKEWPGSEPGNLYDDFLIRDIVCLFKQEA